jgi:hypothetical protein
MASHDTRKISIGFMRCLSLSSAKAHEGKPEVHEG